MRDPMGESLGLAGARTGRDQQRRRRLCVAADAIFDSAALSGVQVAQMPVAIDRSQRRVPRLFPSSAIASKGPVKQPARLSEEREGNRLAKGGKMTVGCGVQS